MYVHARVCVCVWGVYVYRRMKDLTLKGVSSLIRKRREDVGRKPHYGLS